VAGALAGLAGEAANNRFPLDVHYPPGFEKAGGYEKLALRVNAVGEAQHVAEQKKTAAVDGILGLLLGVALGITGGLAIGSLRSALLAALIGGVLGAAAGSGLAALLVPVFYRFMDPESGLLWLFMVHAGTFSAVGAAGGFALGWGLGDRHALWRATLGGFFGGLIGAFALETIISVEFPFLRTFDPVISEPIPRVAAHLCAAFAAALLAGIAAGAPRPTA
jgi:hypothetical protein